MPRTRLDQRNQRFEKLIVLIWGTLRAHGLSMDDFAKAVGVTKPSLYSRKNIRRTFQ